MPNTDCSQSETHADGAFQNFDGEYYNDGDGSNEGDVPCEAGANQFSAGLQTCTCTSEYERVDAGTVYKTELTSCAGVYTEGGVTKNCADVNGEVRFGPTESSRDHECEVMVAAGTAFGCSSCACTHTSVALTPSPTTAPTTSSTEEGGGGGGGGGGSDAIMIIGIVLGALVLIGGAVFFMKKKA